MQKRLKRSFLVLLKNISAHKQPQFLGGEFSMEKFRASGNILEYTLMPMTDIHLHSDLYSGAYKPIVTSHMFICLRDRRVYPFHRMYQFHEPFNSAFGQQGKRSGRQKSNGFSKVASYQTVSHGINLSKPLFICSCNRPCLPSFANI